MESISGIQQFLNYVVGLLARNKNAISITHREEGVNRVQFVVKVDPDDAPRILGKENRGLNSLKSLTIAAAAHIGVQARLYFDGPMKPLALNNGGGDRRTGGADRDRGDRGGRPPSRPGGSGPRRPSSGGGGGGGERRGSSGPRRA